MSNPIKPKVSVITPTYNQEKYIRQALDGFISQKTDFDFEIIVADDHSTDSTPHIIEEYARTHLGIIRPIIRKKNIGVAANFKDALNAARGEYIALCEGDDYWTDPEKLQLQVDFLDDNPGYALCFHPVKVIFENKEQASYVYPDPKQGSNFTVEKLLQANFVQTNSIMYRRQSYQKMPEDILPVDWYLHLYHAQFGGIGFIDRTMSVYRRHPDGVWWDSHNNRDKFWEKNGLAHLAMYREVLKLYGDNKAYGRIVYEHIFDALDALINLPKTNGTFQKAIGQFPELVEEFASHLSKTLKKTKAELQKQQTEYAAAEATLNQELQEKELIILHKEQEVNLIKASKLWKLRDGLLKLAGK
ncbi:MAG TPA: glycosyltransferase [Candidatus Saccharimonadales bacterium]